MEKEGEKVKYHTIERNSRTSHRPKFRPTKPSQDKSKARSVSNNVRSHRSSQLHYLRPPSSILAGSFYHSKHPHRGRAHSPITHTYLFFQPTKRRELCRFWEWNSSWFATSPYGKSVTISCHLLFFIGALFSCTKHLPQTSLIHDHELSESLGFRISRGILERSRRGAINRECGRWRRGDWLYCKGRERCGGKLWYQGSRMSPNADALKMGDHASR